MLAATVAAPSVSAADTPAPAPSPGTSQNVDQLTQELTKDQAQLQQLTSQVESAQGKLDLLNKRVADDQARQKELSAQLTQLARTEYELPTVDLTTILQSRSLDQLLGAVAQSRLVAAKQRDLLQQQKQLKAQDDAARAEAAKELAKLSSARDAAAKVASDAQAAVDQAKAQAAAQAQAQAQAAAQAAAQAQAAAIQQQAQAAASVSAPTTSLPASSTQSGGTNPNRFAYGNCTYYVASLVYIPWLGNAIDWWPNARAYGYAEGQTPQVGAIMVSSESSYGHVSLVTAVNGDGSWTVTEMNYQGFNIVDTRTVTPGSSPVVGFIYGAH